MYMHQRAFPVFLLMLFFAVGVVFAGAAPSRVYADQVLYQNAFGSATAATTSPLSGLCPTSIPNSTWHWEQKLGNNMAGVITQIFIAQSNSNAISNSNTAVSRLYCYSDSGYSVPCDSSPVSAQASQTSASGGAKYMGGTISPSYSMSAGNYYLLSATSTGPNGNCSFGNTLRGEGSDLASTPAMWQNGLRCFNTASSTPSAWYEADCTASPGTGSINSLGFQLWTGSPPFILPSFPETGHVYDGVPLLFAGAYNRGTCLSYSYAHFIFSYTSTGSTTEAYVPLTNCGLTLYNFTFDANYFPFVGDYTFRANLTSNNNTGLTGGCTILEPCTTLSASSTFSLATLNPASPTNPIFQIPSSTSTSQVLTCDENDALFGESFCLLFQYLFYPDQTVFTRFQELGAQLKNKPPMGYWQMASTTLAGFSTTTSAFSGLYAVPFFTTLIDAAFALVIVVVCVFWLFNRMRFIEL